MESAMAQENFEFATIEINVTTCCGVVPVEGARVTVSYEGLPDGRGAQMETHLTDKNGRSEPFRMRTRRVRVNDRYVNFPKNHGCNVSVSADGYVLTSARDIPIFPSITVRRSFDLLPKNAKSDA